MPIPDELLAAALAGADRPSGYAVDLIGRIACKGVRSIGRCRRIDDCANVAGGFMMGEGVAETSMVPGFL